MQHTQHSGCLSLVNRTNLLGIQNISFTSNADWKKLSASELRQSRDSHSLNWDLPERQGCTVKLFFQGISWNAVSEPFHETWNTFIKYFFTLRWAYTMRFFFHELEIFILKEKCRNISGSEMCVVKYSVCLRNQVSFIRSW